MKKSISLMLGLTFIAGGLFVSFSEASRDEYHVYLMTQKNQKRDIPFRSGRTKHSKISRYQNTKLFDLKNEKNPYFKARNYKRTRQTREGVKPPRLQFPQNKFTFKSLRGVEKRTFKVRNFKDSREKTSTKKTSPFESLKQRTFSKNYRGVVLGKKEFSLKNTSFKNARNFRNTRRR